MKNTKKNIKKHDKKQKLKSVNKMVKKLKGFGLSLGDSLFLLEYDKLKDLDKSIMYFNNQCETHDISSLNIPNKITSNLTCDKYQLQLIKPLGTGSYNKTILVEDNKQNKYCLRITHKNINQNIEKNELDGLYLQSFLSLPIEKGGVGCKYICGCYGFGNYILRNTINPMRIGIESNKGVYGILEYVEGGDLFNEMERKYQSKSKFSELEVSQIIGRLLKAVNCIHQHNFVHLDIKPENILCSDKDNRDIRLIDFGFIKYINPQEKCLDARIHGVVGTPGYLSPELINRECYDFKTDIWSIGITMLNLLLLQNDFSSYMYNRKAKYSYVDIFKLEYKLKKDKLSNECIDLLKNMLVEKDNRYTALQCLEHPWIYNNLPDDKCYEPIPNINRNIIKKFCNQYSDKINYAEQEKELQKKQKSGNLQNCSISELENRFYKTCNK